MVNNKSDADAGSGGSGGSGSEDAASKYTLA